jgi:hypothetical protein
MAESDKARCTRKLKQLRHDFASWQPHLKELADHMAPRRARWSRTDFNRGTKINNTIINNTPLLAARTMASGFMAAVTNPMSEWFRLTPPDPDLGEYGPVKRYLHVREERLRWAFSMGSYYRGLADGIYPDLGLFGFGCGLMDEDPVRILSLKPFSIGEYYLGASSNDEVDTVGRDVPMTVHQFVEKFVLQPDGSLDWSRASRGVKGLWDAGSHEHVVEVAHLVEPSWNWEPGTLGPRGMRWTSCWWEPKGDEDRLIRRGGFEQFPFLAPRWSPRDGEAYGRSPGQEVLGDAKQLQHHEKELARLIDLSGKPPTVADENMRGARLSLVPGDNTYVPRGQTEGFRPVFQVNPAAITALLEHIRRCEDRIDRGMFADLFARILRDDRSQRATATEIDQISQEVASMVGPVLFRLDAELYAPSIERASAILERRGFFPPPPPELQGQPIKAEFISVLHQAQKGVGLQPLRVFVSEVLALASARQDALDKLNADEIVDEIANLTGVKPDLVLSDDEVAKLRAARQARQQAQEQGQAMLAAAKGAKDLGTTPAPSGDNLLGGMLPPAGQLSPAGSSTLGAILGNLTPSGATAGAVAPFGSVAGGLA